MSQFLSAFDLSGDVTTPFGQILIENGRVFLMNTTPALTKTAKPMVTKKDLGELKKFSFSRVRDEMSKNIDYYKENSINPALMMQLLLHPDIPKHEKIKCLMDHNMNANFIGSQVGLGIGIKFHVAKGVEFYMDAICRLLDDPISYHEATNVIEKGQPSFDGIHFANFFTYLFRPKYFYNFFNESHHVLLDHFLKGNQAAQKLSFYFFSHDEATKEALNNAEFIKIWQGLDMSVYQKSLGVLLGSGLGLKDKTKTVQQLFKHLSIKQRQELLEGVHNDLFVRAGLFKSFKACFDGLGLPPEDLRIFGGRHILKAIEHRATMIGEWRDIYSLIKKDQNYDFSLAIGMAVLRKHDFRSYNFKMDETRTWQGLIDLELIPPSLTLDKIYERFISEREEIDRSITRDNFEIRMEKIDILYTDLQSFVEEHMISHAIEDSTQKPTRSHRKRM